MALLTTAAILWFIDRHYANVFVVHSGLPRLKVWFVEFHKVWKIKWKVDQDVDR